MGNYKCDEWAQTGRQNENYPKTTKKVIVEKTESGKEIVSARIITQRCFIVVKKCDRIKRLVEFEVCIGALENWKSG